MRSAYFSGSIPTIEPARRNSASAQQEARGGAAMPLRPWPLHGEGAMNARSRGGASHCQLSSPLEISAVIHSFDPATPLSSPFSSPAAGPLQSCILIPLSYSRLPCLVWPFNARIAGILKTGLKASCSASKSFRPFFDGTQGCTPQCDARSRHQVFFMKK